MTRYGSKFFIAFVLVLGFASSAKSQSVDISPLMEKECQWDYHNFCSQYGIGSVLQAKWSQAVQGLRGRADRGG